MTLVELLVVVAIIGLLAVTVLPNVANTTESRRSREAARTVAALISKAQSRSVGRNEWSGFMLRAAGADSFAAIDFFSADVPPVYEGDTAPAFLTITGAPTTIATATSSQIASFVLIGGTANDLIRFAGGGPWYEVVSAGPGTIVFRMRGEVAGAAKSASGSEGAGYSSKLTPWPPIGVALPFEILRQPLPSGSPTTLAEGRAVDLFWSGYGPPQVGLVAGTYQRFGLVAGPGCAPYVLFDGSGRVRQVFLRSAAGVATRNVATGPVFLLVGRPDRAGQDYDPKAGATTDSLGANWQYADSYWVAIDPASGVVKVAECAAYGEDDNRNGVLDVGEDVNNNSVLDVDVVASQKWIRNSLLARE